MTASDKQPKANILNRFVTHWFTTGTVFYLNLCIVLLFIGGWCIYWHHILPGGFPYLGRQIATIAYYFHVPAGCAYFLIGIHQMSPYLRTHYPVTHHVLGRIYFLLQLISTIGVILFDIGAPAAGQGIATISFVGVFYWSWTMWKAYNYARRRDVVKHHVWVVRNYYFAWMIILFRPVLFIVSMAAPTMSIPDSAVMTSTVVVLVMWGIGEWYVYAKYGEGVFKSGHTSILTYSASKPYFFHTPTATILPLPHGQQPELENSTTTLDISTATTNAVHILALPSRHVPSKTEANLINRTALSPTTYLLRLSLPPSDSPLLIPPSHHISLSAPQGTRNYTVISNPQDTAKGLIDLLISTKTHTSSTPKPQKSVSYFLSTTILGTKIPLSIPSSPFTPPTQPSLLLIAGGTGISPFYTLLLHLLPLPQHQQITLIYASKDDPTPLEANLQYLASNYDNFTYLHVSRVRDEDVFREVPNLEEAKQWCERQKGRRGNWTGETAAVLICGPPKMESDVEGWVRERGFKGELVWCFGREGR